MAVERPEGVGDEDFAWSLIMRLKMSGDRTCAAIADNYVIAMGLVGTDHRHAFSNMEPLIRNLTEFVFRLDRGETLQP